ncbi:hypothetical protein BO79DRAFT_29920 [Aspergillus costaricaensis CBS 115574]|uniref:Uncharacterized protein n=1 Tax=Aspergillus costaricaensis CBS 115574 TaxID=1448317 RepID=A0ACD1IBD5_9EURO|nr:hypothetical protein BO79DRAFT_29920 [Aspergillus costaricaensis CBS 115574]RAK87314.1 hypothetical protein BO79DRAFT_29920 [Aspergillus costaricaensis CBS 115574]
MGLRAGLSTGCVVSCLGPSDPSSHSTNGLGQLDHSLQPYGKADRSSIDCVIICAMWTRDWFHSESFLYNRDVLLASLSCSSYRRVE